VTETSSCRSPHSEPIVPYEGNRRKTSSFVWLWRLKERVINLRPCGLGHITVDTFGNLEFHILLLGPLILNDLQKANLYSLM
jgi:hypothetical protein